MHSSGCSCHTQWHSIKSKDNIQGFYQQRWRFQQSHSSISLLGHVNGSIQEPNRFISIQYSSGIPIYYINRKITSQQSTYPDQLFYSQDMDRNFRYWRWLQWSNHAYMERYHQCTLKCHSNKMDQQQKKDPVLSQDQGLQSSVSYQGLKSRDCYEQNMSNG